MQQDRHIHWLRKRELYTVSRLQGLAETATSMQHKSSLTDGVTQNEVGATGLVGWTIADGEFIGGSIVVPYDLDPQFDIGFRVHYTMDHDGAGDATTSWILLHKIIKNGIAYAVAATALSTIIPLLTAYVDDSGDSVVTDSLKSVTGRGLLASATHGLTRTNVEDSAEIMIKLELDAAVNESSVQFLKLEMDYVPQRCAGPGNGVERTLTAQGTN